MLQRRKFVRSALCTLSTLVTAMTLVLAAGGGNAWARFYGAVDAEQMSLNYNGVWKVNDPYVALYNGWEINDDPNTRTTGGYNAIQFWTEAGRATYTLTPRRSTNLGDGSTFGLRVSTGQCGATTSPGYSRLVVELRDVWTGSVKTAVVAVSIRPYYGTYNTKLLVAFDRPVKITVYNSNATTPWVGCNRAAWLDSVGYMNPWDSAGW